MSLSSEVSADLLASHMVMTTVNSSLAVTDLVPISLPSDAHFVQQICGVPIEDGDHLLSSGTWIEGIRRPTSVSRSIAEDLAAFPRHLVVAAPLALSTTNAFVDQSSTSNRECRL